MVGYSLHIWRILPEYIFTFPPNIFEHCVMAYGIQYILYVCGITQWAKKLKKKIVQQIALICVFSPSNCWFYTIVLSKGTRGLPRRFTDLTYSREENKNNVTRCGLFNPRNSIFWVFYKTFDWIILKIWSLVLFSKSVRETYGRLLERSVNRRGRRWIPSDNTMIIINIFLFST